MRVVAASEIEVEPLFHPALTFKPYPYSHTNVFLCLFLSFSITVRIGPYFYLPTFWILFPQYCLFYKSELNLLLRRNRTR